MYRKAWKGLFRRACSNKTRGNSFKPEEGRFRLDSKKKFFTVSVVRHCGTGCLVRLWMPQSLEVRLDRALSNLV